MTATELHRRVEEDTVAVHLPLWFSNLKESLYRVNASPDVADLFAQRGKLPDPCVVMGGGPSFFYSSTAHLLPFLTEACFTIACDRTFAEVTRGGHAPDMTAFLDPGETWTFVKGPTESATAVMSIFVSPQTIKAWKGPIYFFRPRIDTLGDRSDLIDSITQYLTGGKTLLETGGNVGSLCYALAVAMGFKRIILLGLDFSYPEGTPLEQTERWLRYKTAFGEEKAKEQYSSFTHPVFKTKHFTEPVFRAYAENLLAMIRYAREKEGVHTISCSPGLVFSESEDEVECMPLLKALQRDVLAVKGRR